MMCVRQSTEADYESIPVEAYGLAMIKGMGWNKEEGIGRTFKQWVKQALYFNVESSEIFPRL